MHVALDVIFRRNHIHHCTRGMWLDWMAQGTSVTQCLFHDNTLPFEHLMHPGSAVAYGEDLWIEVTHGPTLVDHNILMSTRSIRLSAQGTALVHNLIGGSFTAIGRGTDNGAPTLPSARYTPYHLPHSTDIAGFMTILHGDVRFFNNIFVQQAFHPFLVSFVEKYRDFEWDDGNLTVGTWPFNGYPTREEWESGFEGYCGEGGVRTDRYYSHLPVYSAGNVYFNGACPWEKETDAVVDRSHHIELSLSCTETGWTLQTNLAEFLPDTAAGLITSDTLGMAFEPEQLFENPDGSPILFDTDFNGKKTRGNPIAGPLGSKEDWGKPLPFTTSPARD